MNKLENCKECDAGMEMLAYAMLIAVSVAVFAAGYWFYVG